MDISEFAKRFPDKMQKLTDFVNKDAKTIMGQEAENHFRESFQNEGFTDESLEPWPEVERRKPESPWYGHSGQTGKFSAARTTAKILTGETNELKNAFKYVNTEAGVKVINDKPYAAVHQYGRMAKIYGKKPFKMLARPFVGRSKVMVRKINTELKNRLIEILKSK
jgi:phage gpG-like protein